MAMEVGDVVILPEFGGAKLEMGGKEYFLFREQDILAKINK
jgi:co-chaperonin GroES (HSP10)